MLRRLTGIVAAAALAQSLGGCGTKSNFNRIWGGEDDAGDSRLIEAQAAYDRGDFVTAASLASELVIRDPDNEEASILLGYINLSQGGIDPFILANQLIALSPSNTATGGTTAGTTTGTTGGTTSGLAGFSEGRDSGGSGSDEFAAGGAAGTTTAGATTAGATTAGTTTAAGTDISSTLSQLSGLVTNVSDTDKTTALGHLYAAADNGGTAPVLFTGADAVVVPSEVDYTKPAMIATLQYMSSAINAVCRFVDPSVKPAASADPRNCATTSNARNATDKANFLWAFSHLTEALVYEEVLLYSAPGAAIPGITDVSNAINKVQTVSPTAASFSLFVTQVSEVESAVNLIFDTANSKSMIQAMLNDMNMVTAAFGALSGLPTSVTDKITTALSQLDKLSASFGGDLNARTKALKTQFAQKLSAGLGTKINAAADAAAQKVSGNAGMTFAQAKATPAIANNPNFQQFQTQVTTMCSSFTSLTKDIANAAKPAACQ